MTINECLESIQHLTEENLQILSTINKAFSTKSEHLVVNIDDVQYVIPSFLSLENKINTLQQNLENIVNAPSTGEAFTYFDGTTQRIELSGYGNSPNTTLPSTTSFFGVEQNDIFKDFLNPQPYTRLAVPTIPNNIKNLCVKKVSLKNQDLIDRVKEITGFTDSTVVDGNYVAGDTVKELSYPDLFKVLYLYEEDTDYTDYDTIRRIPLRGQNASGSYTVKTVVRNWHDEDFSEYYEVTLNQPLTYFINEGTIERDMQVGDRLVTYNDKVIMEIIDLVPVTNTLTVKILYGGYVDIVSYEESAQYGSLKFYSSIDFENTKYINVPLEEDRYICLFVAAVNDTTNTRSNWGRGLFYDTYALTDPDGVTFNEYYKNVNNIGDTLYNITKLLNSALYNITVNGMERICSTKPVIDSADLTVTQINKHLNDSETVQNIRNLYAQKNKYKTELDTVQISINNINNILSDLNFNNSDNNRAIYESQLQDLNTRKSELTASILSVTNEISTNVNNSDVPIENAKYHIRGFLNFPTTIDPVDGVTYDVIRMDVEYRYRNRNSVTGNAEVIGENDIFSDWNKMRSEYRGKDFVRVDPTDPDSPVKYPYEFVYEGSNTDMNMISFNQVDIPITQGEVVDIRYRYEYSLGFPFVKIYSDWSDVYTQTFPDEYMKDVALLTIVEENNDDIKKNAMNTMLVQKGLIAHEEDKIVDQNITYFHKPEHIASGFYTDERRIIPLYDMLQSMYSDMESMKSDIYGGLSDSLVVTLYDDTTTMRLQRDKDNEFTTTSYTRNTRRKTLNEMCEIPEGSAWADVNVAYSQLMLNLYNDGEYNMKIYTMFPGANDQELLATSPSRFTNTDYTYDSDDLGVWIQTGDRTPELDKRHRQTYNQVLYFRVKDNMTNEALYSSNPQYTGNPDRTLRNNASILPLCTYSDFSNDDTVVLSTMFPYVGDKNTLCAENGSNFIILQPGDSIDIPLAFYYFINPTPEISSVSQKMEFDIRTSLFNDPDTYKFTVTANYNDTFALQGIKKIDTLSSETLTRANKARTRRTKAQPIVRNGRMRARK